MVALAGHNTVLFSFALDGGEWSVSQPGRFAHSRGAPDAQLLQGEVGFSRHSRKYKNILNSLGIEPPFLGSYKS